MRATVSYILRQNKETYLADQAKRLKVKDKTSDLVWSVAHVGAIALNTSIWRHVVNADDRSRRYVVVDAKQLLPFEDRHLKSKALFKMKAAQRFLDSMRQSVALCRRFNGVILIEISSESEALAVKRMYQTLFSADLDRGRDVLRSAKTSSRH